MKQLLKAFRSFPYKPLPASAASPSAPPSSSAPVSPSAPMQPAAPRPAAARDAKPTVQYTEEGKQGAFFGGCVCWGGRGCGRSIIDGLLLLWWVSIYRSMVFALLLWWVGGLASFLFSLLPTIVIHLFNIVPIGNGGATDHYYWTQTLQETTVGALSCYVMLPSLVCLCNIVHSTVQSGPKT